MDTLESMGWGPAWAMKFEPFADGGLCPGRVFAEQREIYVVQSQHGEALARVSGRLRHEARQRAAFPAVGDWVAIDATGGPGQSVIHALVPRLNRFSRKLAGKDADEQIVAANLDTLFLVTSLNRELNPRRIERYLTATSAQQVEVCVLLSKCDLCERPDEAVERFRSLFPGLAILALSAHTGEGMASDVADLASRCHYRDCRHEQEPLCAVREALETGTLDGRRYENFCKLQREIAYLESQQDPAAERERKERFRRICRAQNKENRRRERR